MDVNLDGCHKLVAVIAQSRIERPTRLQTSVLFLKAHGQGSGANLHVTASSLHSQMNLPHPPPSHNVGTADEMVIEGQVFLLLLSPSRPLQFQTPTKRHPVFQLTKWNFLAGIALQKTKSGHR